MNPDFAPFLNGNGVPTDHTLEPLTGGANNRVYKVTVGDESWVLKQYFQRDNDPRDRFAAEHDYYTALWTAGIRQIPEPLAWNREQNLGLFEYIQGRRLKPVEVTGDRVTEAVNFIIETNLKAGDARLAPASEACFSLAQHYATVDRRIQRLQSITNAEANDFVLHHLTPLWRKIEPALDKVAETVIPAGQRCISPSDFGFHNAHLHELGTLKFFDFEYAGTDDPAKLVCDFFCQPRLPASLEYWDAFTHDFASKCGWNEAFLTRAATLLPVYQIKWCCIMLNEFLRTEQQRREFSGKGEELESRQAHQLEQAKAALTRIRQD